MTRPDPDQHARRLAAEALADDDPTGWFERLYAQAEAGEAVVPWDRGQPHRLLVEWARAGDLDGAGRRALVVGCGPGHDAAFVAGLGFDTEAFDVAETAVRAARDRYAGSGIRFHVADLLGPPVSWHGAFDLVVESYTVQALPRRAREDAIAQVSRMVAPGGTLLVIAAVADSAEGADEGPPWPLTRAEIDAFAAGGLRAVEVAEIRDAARPAVRRWRAEFQRPERAQPAAGRHS